MRQIVASCALVGIICLCTVSAKPVGSKLIRFKDEPPNLSDTLAVAKSPYEPVTLPNTLPGARNENFRTESTLATAESEKLVESSTTNSTRSNQDLDQIKEATGSNGESKLGEAASATRSVETESTAEASPATATTTTLSPTSTAEEAGSPESEKTTSLPAAKESVDPEVSTTTASPESEPKSEEVTEAPTTTTATRISTSTRILAPETTTAELETSSLSETNDKQSTTAASESSTESGTTEKVGSVSPVSEDAAEKPAEDTSKAPSVPARATEVSTTTTESPTTTTEAPMPTTTTTSEPKLEVIAEKEQTLPPTLDSTTTTTTEAPSAPEQPSSPEPEADQPSSPAPEPERGQPSPTPEVEQPSVTVESPSSTAVPEEESISGAPTTTTEAPVEESSSSASINTESTRIPEMTTTTTTVPPTTTTTEAPPLRTTMTTMTTTTTTTKAPSTTTTITTAAPEREDNKRVGNDENNTACNHLPTYNSEEIQKVFREETTFRNGTIKGKFTYINYDQRYRLVHYTRLPYGPVKIDLVGDLGRPDQQGGGLNNRSSSQAAGDIPNAVLQLRNILPNSLFGFPFLNPHSAPSKPITQSRLGLGQKEASGDDSSMYFYSTDSLATPNLLTPSVPVPVLPGHRRPSQQPSIAAADALGQGFFDNLPVGAVQQHQSLGVSARKLKQPNERIMSEPNVLFGAPEQYSQEAASSATSLSSDQQKQPGIVYSYLPPQPQPVQYQYSPLPLYSFYQPNYYNAARQLLTPQQLPYSPAKVKHEPQMETSYLNHQSHQPHSHEHYVAPFMFARPIGLHSDQEPDISKLRLKVKTSKALNVEQSTKSAQLRASPPLYLQQNQQQVPINQQAQPQRQQHRHRAGKQNQELNKPAINTSPIVYHILRSPVGRMYTLPQYNNQAHVIAYDQDE